MPDPNTEHGLMIEVARLRQENGRLETAARAYIEGHELALTRAETAESERDALRAEVKRLREAAAALRDGYDHVAHCRECGEMSVEHCAQAEGENSDAAKAIEARTGIDAALATGGDRG